MDVCMLMRKEKKKIFSAAVNDDAFHIDAKRKKREKSWATVDSVRKINYAPHTVGSFFCFADACFSCLFVRRVASHTILIPFFLCSTFWFNIHVQCIRFVYLFFDAQASIYYICYPVDTTMSTPKVYNNDDWKKYLILTFFGVWWWCLFITHCRFLIDFYHQALFVCVPWSIFYAICKLYPFFFFLSMQFMFSTLIFVLFWVLPSFR